MNVLLARSPDDPADHSPANAVGMPSRSHRGSRARRRLRARLTTRDGAVCFYCATPFTVNVLPTLDHLVPLAVRPTWRQDALVLACLECNHAKGHLMPHRLLRLLGVTGPSAGGLLRLSPAELLVFLRPLVQHRFSPGLIPRQAAGSRPAA